MYVPSRESSDRCTFVCYSESTPPPKMHVNVPRKIRCILSASGTLLTHPLKPRADPVVNAKQTLLSN
jgi:hypothetical protein